MKAEQSIDKSLLLKKVCASICHQDSAMNKPVVLITGALTGIGRATAVAFARKGAKLVVAGRRDEAGKALASRPLLRSLGA